jgi:hypothetical protein
VELVHFGAGAWDCKDIECHYERRKPAREVEELRQGNLLRVIVRIGDPTVVEGEETVERREEEDSEVLKNEQENGEPVGNVGSLDWC